ncbi:hypothetical protein AB6A40_003071 [Gnathostoma spinigerum]|uniref:PDZ domain-containing protein n=1 Tax=Gnathostoma spinigerum TaxID=75299 RepID=A0ABD6EAR1_9BILA
MNRVLVSRVDEGSLAASSLQVHDRICDINGTAVSDKDVCRNLLVRSLQKQRYVTMVIERPVSPEAIEWSKNALVASLMQPPSVAMASDVREIAARQAQKMLHNKGQVKKQVGIMKYRGRRSSDRENSSPGHRVRIRDEERKEVLIASDTVGRKLKKVRE